MSFLSLRPLPTPTLFPTRRSSDLRKCGSPFSNQGLRRCKRDRRRQFPPRHRGSYWTHRAKRGRQDDVIQYPDRKSTRLNSSHVAISYAVFCLKKKTKQNSNKVRER